MSKARRLAIDYLSLPYHTQVKIADEMGIATKGRFNSQEIGQDLFFKAKRDNQVDKLGRLIEESRIK